MKILFIFSFSLLTINLFSQINGKNVLILDLGCGFDVQPSKIVERTYNRVKKDRYSFIKRKLYKMNPAESFFAAVTLIVLDSLNKIKLSQKDLKRISILRDSNKSFNYCSASTVFSKVSLKDALSKNNKHSIFQEVEKFVIRIFDYY